MSIHVNLNTPHHVVAANAHYYKTPTEERYIDRTLPNHDLIYLAEGSWSITENEQDYPLQKDDVLLLSAGRHHYTRFPCAPGTRTFCIHVSCNTENNSGCNNFIQLPTLIHAHNNPKIKKYFSEITTAFWQQGNYKERQMSALLDLLLLELLFLTESAQSQKGDLAEQAIAIITSAPHMHYTSKDVADMLCTSTKTLDKSMLHKTGLSFHSYQKERKLEMAASLLETDPDLQLREIANTLGFYDEFHLSKSFKQKYQVSPKEYRTMRSVPEP
ncbi:MAG: helix-turn-helix transcriptional regulator [Lachnospiraceae bacterium]|nr:helix-turn-helix transcriptional regulator [Lachnospiraceae bacterium]